MKLAKESRRIVVKTTDGSTITGNVNLNSETRRIDRVSDLLTKGQSPFLVMYEAMFEGRLNPYMIVNKMQIVWVTSDEVFDD
ncbi:MAG: hypothetical protein CSA22_08705 [Deltaproteobacteria bacterium]|nr:MAG: hypothetical protein CSA22_08705 [Deltaproteobacteria bacterium]